MQLYEEIRADRERGARRLVEEYKNRLYATALMLCGDEHEAEDLVFRTFAQAINRIRKYKPSGSFFNWVFTIMMNFRRMDIRRKKSRIAMYFPEELPEVADLRPNPGEGLALESDARRVREAVSKLPAGLRDVVVLRYFEDLTTAEIAEALGIPDGTVRSRLHYAKDLLYSFLNGK